MAGSRCSVCGREEFLPFRCRFCGKPHCLDHRMPENHQCAGLEDWRARPAERPAPARPEREVRVRGPSPVGEGVRRASRWARRSATHLFLAAVLLVYAWQVLGGVLLAALTGSGLLEGYAILTCALALGPCGPFQSVPYALPEKPWTIITNIFAHATPIHLLFNALFLYFFGLELEHRIGRKTFTGLFFAAGIVAAVGQVVLFRGAVLGASGALMGVLGTLTVLAPRMRVILWFVPVPLWVMTLFFILLDVGGLAGTGNGIANLAHLLGLALGLLYGLRLQRRGVLPRVASSWASQRRY